VSEPGQSLPALHSTQVPSLASLQMRLPGSWVHEFPLMGGCERTPPVHLSSVHWFVSAPTSVSSICVLMTLPLPSQVFLWQSPDACVGVTNPAGLRSKSHTPPPEHVRVWHSLSTPGQSPGTRQLSAQSPTELQKCPPLHIMPVRAGFEGVPFVQTSLVHSLPSTGRSLSSTALTTLPLPSHLFVWQS
jgi:hypothetical protein